MLENPVTRKGMKPLLDAELERLKGIINDIDSNNFTVKRPMQSAISTIHNNRTPEDYRYMDFNKPVPTNHQDIILNQLRKEKIPEILLYTSVDTEQILDMATTIRNFVTQKGTGTFSFTDVNTGDKYTVKNWSAEEIKQNTDAETQLRKAQEPVSQLVHEPITEETSLSRFALYKGDVLTNIFYDANDIANFVYSTMTPKANYADSKVSGRTMYNNLARVFGSQREASMFLLRANFDGIRMLNMETTDVNDERYYNYVVFDTDAVTFEDQARMMMQDMEDGRYSKEVLEFFKDSKIRDADGNLMVVYHGTAAREDFSIFNIEGLKLAALPDSYLGSHFADNPLVAETFSQIFHPVPTIERTAGSRIYPVYLNIKNPMIYDSYAELKNAIGPEDEIGKAVFNEDMQLAINVAIDLATQFRNNLINQGYDGIIYTNELDGGISYIAFNSNQIKSIYNTQPTLSDDIMFMHSGNYTNILNTDPDEVTDKIANVKESYETQVLRKAAESISKETGRNLEDIARRLYDEYKSGALSIKELESMNNTIDFSQNITHEVYHNLDTAEKSFIPTIGQFMKDNWEGLKHREEGRSSKPDLTFIEKVLSSVEFYAYKYPASKKIFEAVLDHISKRYQISRRITQYDPSTNESLLTTLDDYKKNNSAGFTRVEKIVIQYDKNRFDPAAKERIEFNKLNNDLTDARDKLAIATDEKDRQDINRGINILEDKINIAKNNMTMAQIETLKAAGLTDEDTTVWMAVRQIFENALQELINHGKVIIKQYEKDGRMVPEYVYTDDADRIQRINLREAIKIMGELVGSYFPRMRTPGRFKLHIEKQTLKDGTVLPAITILYTNEHARHTDAARFRNEGYRTVDESFSPVPYSPEDVINFIGNITTVKDALTRVINNMSGKNTSISQVPGISHADWHSYIKADGTTEE
jgi:hypothetical protein